MTRYEEIILEKLIDKYERSKGFTGKGKVLRRTTVVISDIFPGYDDEAEYDLFTQVNEAIKELSDKGFIFPGMNKNGVIKYVELNISMLGSIYCFLSRTPKALTNEQLLHLLTEYENRNLVLSLFCAEQKKRLSENKKAEFFDGDIVEYENILKAVAMVTGVSEETYIRDFSVRVLGDSKAFEKIKKKVTGLLFRYGDFPQEETILEELNIVKNPGHVYIKGNGVITLNGQTLDLSALNGDIAISSTLLKNIDLIKVTGDRVITIENLTTFNSFSEPGAFVLYLGGYHNSHRRSFIKRIYEQNPDKRYLHYGDIDAGGFYILLHLRRKTEVPFEAYHMDIETLRRYSEYTKRLTENDRKRLVALSNSQFAETVNYMLENNCKLEQEVEDSSFL